MVGVCYWKMLRNFDTSLIERSSKRMQAQMIRRLVSQTRRLQKLVHGGTSFTLCHFKASPGIWIVGQAQPSLLLLSAPTEALHAALQETPVLAFLKSAVFGVFGVFVAVFVVSLDCNGLGNSRNDEGSEERLRSWQPVHINGVHCDSCSQAGWPRRAPGLCSFNFLYSIIASVQLRVSVVARDFLVRMKPISALVQLQSKYLDCFRFVFTILFWIKKNFDAAFREF